MSRIGRKPVEIPEKVKVETRGRVLHVEGPLGGLDALLPDGVGVEIHDRTASVSAPTPTRGNRGYQGLVRALLANMVRGVSKGYERTLEITGVGYRAELAGDTLTLQLGYSHPISMKLPKGVVAKIEKQTVVTIKGSDKQLVGQVAAKIRSYRKPEPYKGKGVKYSDETIRRKVGKAGAK
ncbi:MAG: 50S ribosomal protein L6 [Myxococcota bacterium]